MSEVVYDDDAFRKKKLSFVKKGWSALERAEMDSYASILVKDEKGEVTKIPFRVTRNVRLGENARWIYGMVLNAPDGEYRQIELKFHKDNPERDTVEVLLRAPPSFPNILR